MTRLPWYQPLTKLARRCSCLSITRPMIIRGMHGTVGYTQEPSTSTITCTKVIIIPPSQMGDALAPDCSSPSPSPSPHAVAAQDRFYTVSSHLILTGRST